MVVPVLFHSVGGFVEPGGDVADAPFALANVPTVEIVGVEDPAWCVFKLRCWRIVVAIRHEIEQLLLGGDWRAAVARR